MDPEPSSFISLLIASSNTDVIFGIALLIILLLCSALISGAEVALFSLTKADFEDDTLQSNKKVKIIAKLLERPKKLLATILVANNFINIAIVILFASLSVLFFKGIDLVFDFY